MFCSTLCTVNHLNSFWGEVFFSTFFSPLKFSSVTLFLFFLHVAKVVIYGMSKLFTIIVLKCWYQTNFGKELYSPFGFHFMAFLLAWVVMNHSYSKPSSDISVYCQ